jgi:hypothetical protein
MLTVTVPATLAGMLLQVMEFPLPFPATDVLPAQAVPPKVMLALLWNFAVLLAVTVTLLPPAVGPAAGEMLLTGMTAWIVIGAGVAVAVGVGFTTTADVPGAPGSGCGVAAVVAIGAAFVAGKEAGVVAGVETTWGTCAGVAARDGGRFAGADAVGEVTVAPAAGAAPVAAIRLPTIARVRRSRASSPVSRIDWPRPCRIIPPPALPLSRTNYGCCRLRERTIITPRPTTAIASAPARPLRIGIRGDMPLLVGTGIELVAPGALAAPFGAFAPATVVA